MRPRDLFVLATAGVGWLAGSRIAAQQSVVLRYRPEMGRVTRTLTEVRTTTTLTGFPAVPDGATFEDQARISATLRVAGDAPDGTVVAVTIDSISARSRMGTDPWVDRGDTLLVGRAAEAIVSPRFDVVGIRSRGPTDADVLQTMGAGVIGLGFTFPQEAVTVGEAFETGGRVRTRVTTEASTGVAVDEVVFGDLALVLDSVTVVGADTLSYFQFRGAVAPRSGAAAGEASDVVTSTSGGFAGRLVWSARWGAFVSGAVRVRVQGRITTTGPGGPVEAHATWDRLIVHSVRP
jgi:hypothetical protein